MIHIKGYVHTVNRLNYNNEFHIQKDYTITRFSVGISFWYIPKGAVFPKGKWKGGLYKYTSTPERYFQMLHQELYTRVFFFHKMTRCDWCTKF